MGWIEMKLPQGTVFLGDEHGRNQRNRELGLPHYDKNGEWVSQQQIDNLDKIGE